MESLITNQWLMILVFCTGAIGLMVCWFGVLVALVTALGHEKWIWGISIFFLGPFTGIPYTLINKDAEYPRQLMIRGLLMLLPSVLYLIYAVLK